MTSLSVLEKRISEDDIPEDDVNSFEFQTASFVNQEQKLEKFIDSTPESAASRNHHPYH